MNFALKKSLDNLGRVVIPKSMRDYYGMDCGDDVVVMATDEGILIIKLTEEEEKLLESARRDKKRRG